MRNTHAFAWPIVTALLFFAPLAYAQSSVAPDWSQAIDAAWERSQEKAQQQGQLLRVEASRTAAQSLWAAPPAVELDHRAGRSPSDGRTRESEAGLVWPLWLPGQRAARTAAADAEVRAAQHGVEAARWRVAGEVRETALDVGAQQAEVRQAELQTRLMKALAEDVERRVRAGDLARADAMATRAELLQTEVQQQDAQRRLNAARNRWTLMTGMQDVPVQPARIPASAPPPLEHPELAAATLNIERARRQLTAAERSRREPPELGVRVRREADNTGSATSTGVSLRIPFATADRNALLLAQAQSELAVALAEEQRVRDRLMLEREAARVNVQGATQQLEAERERSRLLRERAGLIEKSFKAGDTALPELLRALAAAAQADAAVVRQQAALELAQARLAQSQGISP